jgi:hypothetical protein
MSDVRVSSAGFAGALALAAGSAAYGSIIVVAPPSNMPNAASPAANPATGVTSWDVNGDAVVDFGFQFRNPQAASPANGVLWQANMDPATAGAINAVAGFGGGATFAYGTKLNSGDLIGPTFSPPTVWKNVGQVILGSFYRFSGVISPYGGFAAGSTPSSSVVRGFVGFRFSIAGATRYGWLDVEVRGSSTGANTGGMFFFGAAYEDSGQPIQAGAVPAPGSLGALALGAVACARRSRRRAS